MKEPELVLKGCNITIDQNGYCTISAKEGEKPPLLKTEDIQKISDLIGASRKIDGLAIGFDISAKEEVDNIFKILEANEKIKSLDINKISTKEVASDFKEKLIENQTLTYIGTGHWDDDIVAKEVIEAISRNPRITMFSAEIALRNCNISISDQGAYISSKEGAKPPLLNAEDIQKINGLIKANQNISELSIGFKITTKEEVDQIFGILEENKSHLTGLGIGNMKKGISSYLGNKLVENKTLTSITAGGWWDDITSKDVIGAISRNPRIIKLNVESYSEDCLKNTAELLVETTTLKALNIRPKLFEGGFEQFGLLAAFSENTSLTKLNVNIRSAGEAMFTKDGKDPRDPKGKAKGALKGNKYWREPIDIDTGHQAVKFDELDKQTIAENVAENKVRVKEQENKQHTPGLKDFVDSVFNDDKISSRKGIKIDATKQKLSTLLCDKLQGIIDTPGENSKYIQEVLTADKETQKKLSHSIIDGLSCLKIEGAEFKYQPIRKTTDILTKIVEFCCGVIMYPKDGGKTLDKCLKNHTELVITDHTKFALSISNMLHPEQISSEEAKGTKPKQASTKEVKAKSIDDVLDGVFKEAKAAKDKWTAKVQSKERGGGIGK